MCKMEANITIDTIVQFQSELLRLDLQSDLVCKGRQTTVHLPKKIHLPIIR